MKRPPLPQTHVVTKTFEPEASGSAPSAAYLAEWMNSRPIPSCIITSDLALIWLNRAARQMFEERTTFLIDEGRLSCSDEDQLPVLSTLIETLGRQPGVWVYRVAQGRHRVVRVEPITSQDVLKVYGLTLYPEASKDSYQWADLTAVFGLTKAQSLVVQSMFAGLTAEEISIAQGVSLDTIRTHIKRLYLKLSVTSREQLFALISPFQLR